MIPIGLIIAVLLFGVQTEDPTARCAMLRRTWRRWSRYSRPHPVDLSGYIPANTGTQSELQRVIDRFPINRAVLLCDAGSDRAFIEPQVRYRWSQTASGSPTAEHTILVAVTGAGVLRIANS